MNNFTSQLKQPWTTYDNRLIQGKTIFKKPYQKLCYLYLASLANCSEIFPGIKVIAESICGSTKTAERTVQELEEMGLIEVIRTPGKPNYYILKDYFEVCSTTDSQSVPTDRRHTTDSESVLPQTESLSKTKTIKLKTKNKISSSDSKNSIDLVLKEKYPAAPFYEVKEQMLNDETLIIETDKQYKSMLEYRLKNWKLKTAKRPKKVIRKEIVPDWFDQENNIIVDPSELEAKKAAIAEKLARFRN